MKKQKVRWPESFVLDEKKKKYAIQGGIDPYKLKEFWEDFHDSALTHDYHYADWDAAFRMRVRKAKMWNQFQAPPQKKKTSQATSNDKLRKAFNALVYGGNIEDIAHRLKLSDYEQDCVMMAYNGGAKKVKKLSNQMFGGQNDCVSNSK